MNARAHGLDILRAVAIPLTLFIELPIVASASENLPLERTTQETLATPPPAAYSEGSWLAYDSPSSRPGSSFWQLDEPHSRLVSTDSDADNLTATGQSESLFSKDYWKLVGSDIKVTLTAPAHWDRKDWLIFGGVTAGIGLAVVFDEDI